MSLRGWPSESTRSRSMPGRAAQVAVERRLDSSLADLVTWYEPRVRALLQLRLA